MAGLPLTTDWHTPRGLGGELRLEQGMHSKKLGDAPMEEKSLTRAAARNQCGLEHWTPHDLRRTAATHMNRFGINFIWVEKVLNHKLQGMLKV